MITIIDTMHIGNRSCTVFAEIPEANDIRQSLPRRAAELAIKYMSLTEQDIRHHLTIGSTPPTKVPIWHPPKRLMVIQKAIWSIFETSRGVICL